VVFKHILLPLDGSQLAECVLPHARALASAGYTRITVVRVLASASESNPDQPVDPLNWHFNRVEAENYLLLIAKQLNIARRPDAEIAILEGDPAQRLIEFAHQNEVDLIVLSSHGQSGVSRWNVSSVVRKLIQNVHLSTMLVRAYDCKPGSMEKVRYKQVLTPLDGSLRAEAALPVATGIVQSHRSRLILAHILQRPEVIQRLPPSTEDQQLIDQVIQRSQSAAEYYIEQLKNRLPFETETEIRVSNNVSTTLAQMIADRSVDLVVLNAHGHSGDINRPFGSIATSLIEYGTTPLLMLQDLSPGDIHPGRAEEAAREQQGHA
jgi:nucleotide-binding universal stress UspA family protein